MADSQQNIDWTAVRQVALQCLSAASDLIWWGGFSQEGDYDVERAALHLAAIDRACDTLKRAIHTFSPGSVAVPITALVSSAEFDAIARASVGDGPRPDFQFGGICCATAHQSAYVLLRSAILQLENRLNAELDRSGQPDNIVASIEDLHAFSPEALRDILVHMERVAPLENLLAGQGLNVVRAWIDREWAAVSHAPANGDGAANRIVEPHDFHVTLQQAAPLVSKHKRTLERWQKEDSNFPLPEVQGQGGTASLWKWSILRLYLQERTKLALPEYHPSDPYRPGYGQVES